MAQTMTVPVIFARESFPPAGVWRKGGNPGAYWQALQERAKEFQDGCQDALRTQNREVLPDLSQRFSELVERLKEPIDIPSPDQFVPQLALDPTPSSVHYFAKMESDKERLVVTWQGHGRAWKQTEDTIVTGLLDTRWAFGSLRDELDSALQLRSWVPSWGSDYWRTAIDKPFHSFDETMSIFLSKASYIHLHDPIIEVFQRVMRIPPEA